MKLLTRICPKTWEQMSLDLVLDLDRSRSRSKTRSRSKSRSAALESFSLRFEHLVHAGKL